MEIVTLENPPDAISIKVEDTSALMPPPASQSYFDQFTNFTPNASAPFEDEFSRLASSQGLVSGSQEFRRERTKAIRNELKYHYSSQPNGTPETTEATPKPGKDGPTDQEKLDIYQSMCREIGIDQRGTIPECKRELKKVLVNIVDYIDARRIPGKKIEIWDWDDFDAFREYSLRDNKRIDRDVAKADGGFLSALLQNLVCPGRKRRRGGRLATAVTDKSTTRKRSEEGPVQHPKRARLSAVHFMKSEPEDDS
ncbi:hypothetical protein Hte_012614 [Hypoxylon texense]